MQLMREGPRTDLQEYDSNHLPLPYLPEADLPAALEACLQLVPLDTFVDQPAIRMMQVDAPDELPEVQKACQKVIDKAEGRHVPLAGVTREAFYERARRAYGVITTREQRVYGCILITKGVVSPPEGD